jgi:hypothetical protein
MGSRAIGLVIRNPFLEFESYGKARRCTGAAIANSLKALDWVAVLPVISEIVSGAKTNKQGINLGNLALQP